MSSQLLDTGIVIRHLRGDRPAVKFIRGLLKFGRPYIATISRLEIYTRVQPNERYKTQHVLARFHSLDLNRQIAERAGEYVNAFRLSGKHLSVPDAIIAATAATQNLTLVTLNVADFRDIPGISLYPLPDWQ